MTTPEKNSSVFMWNEQLIQQCINNKTFQILNIQEKNIGSTGFIYACSHHPELALIMLEKNNIDFNKKNNLGYTGFMMACQFHPELALIMLERNNIDFNIQNLWDETAFMVACKYQPKIITSMLEHSKIDKDLKDNRGRTSQDWAKEYNSESFKIYQKFLIEKQHQKLKNNIKSENKTKKSKAVL